MALMCYTNEAVWLAKKFNEAISLERIDSTHNYKVSIARVASKDGYRRLEIFGLGFTVEDACNDFFRRSRGCTLIHAVSDLEVEVV